MCCRVGGAAGWGIAPLPPPPPCRFVSLFLWVLVLSHWGFCFVSRLCPSWAGALSRPGSFTLFFPFFFFSMWLFSPPSLQLQSLMRVKIRKQSHRQGTDSSSMYSTRALHHIPTEMLYTDTRCLDTGTGATCTRFCKWREAGTARGRPIDIEIQVVPLCCPGGLSSAVIQRTLTGCARALGPFFLLCPPRSGPVEGRPPPPTSHHFAPARAEIFSQQPEETWPMPQRGVLRGPPCPH